MRADLVDLLCCPVDGEHPLALHVFEPRDGGAEVEAGALVCPRCGRWFAIMDGVPHLVRDGLRLVEEELEFLDRQRQRLPAEAGQWKPYGADADL